MAIASTSVVELFHPLVGQWFARRFGEPTEPQAQGWPEIAAGRDTLIAAPTGSGKTLAAFLWCIDELVRRGLAGELPDAPQVIYISPLKALSNDIHRNLEVPLAELRQLAADEGAALPQIRTAVRTGDTPASQRQAMLRRPPHILVTTPESLFLLLAGSRSRELLRDVRTVIVDEIHALARDKRGSHLSLSLARLDALASSRPVRIGLSATQRPIDQMARFLVGADAAAADSNGHAPANGSPAHDARPCVIVDTGHARDLDLTIEVPPSELSAVCSHEQWAEVYDRLTQLITSHRSTLVFVNTRRLAERVAHNLSELLGEEAVASHHGSLSREMRLAAEERLKRGQLRAIVATASLELGIDVGYVDLVCQIGSPRSIATLLQRVGRAGHSLGALPKGRLFPLSRDELMECLALLRAVRRGRLDQIEMPIAPLDILAQQIVAACASDEWKEDDLFELARAAWPYRDLRRDDFDEILQMLGEGVDGRRKRGAYLHRDRVNGVARARRGARIAAATSGGAIPDTADFQVYTADERTFVGTVNEDFALESLAGDVFLLGNNSWRIRYVRAGEVIVDDAQGAPATIPFWLGEAPGRTFELSEELSELRQKIAQWLQDALETEEPAVAHLMSECGVDDYVARQAVTYMAAQVAAIGLVPTQQQVVFERFFDESGGMQLVIHAPFGSRINRAWGLALRKRFCRSFNFELQASADDNGVLLSLGPQHSFPLTDMFRLLERGSAEEILKQALLAVPMFKVRWRWNATRALAVLRREGGHKVPPQLQRFRADDLLTSVFPQSTACLEHITGDIEIPDHPLVRQTVYDCLHEAMDIDRWLALLGRIDNREIELVARDTREPSPFSYEILNANPYAFLDDAPLEERRARAVATRRTISPDDVRDLAALDADAIARVRAEAWPEVRSADELHDVLVAAVAFPADEGRDWQTWFEELVSAGRATSWRAVPDKELWVATEQLPLVRALHPDGVATPTVVLPAVLDRAVEAHEATLELVRGYVECRGPVTASRISEVLTLRATAVQAALEALEGEGFVLRGTFEHSGGDDSEPQWCERRLLARIHRLTLQGARARVKAVPPEVFVKFLCERHGLAPGSQLHGRRALREKIELLQGFELPAGAWEDEVLPARLRQYDPDWLDELSLFGEVGWARLQPPRKADGAPWRGGGMARNVAINLFLRSDVAWLLPPDRESQVAQASSNAMLVLETLEKQGASFFYDLGAVTGLLPAQVEDALAELAALGLATADGFASIRPLVSPDRKRRGDARRRRARRRRGVDPSAWRTGRWSRFPGPLPEIKPETRVDRWARQLVRRWGVVFRDLLVREPLAPPWRELVRLYRRMEARGELLGGRFIEGVSGEQYAEAPAVTRLRELRDRGPDAATIIVSTADPLNLTGVLASPVRLAATQRGSLAYRDGKLIATRTADGLALHDELDPHLVDRLERAMRVTALVRAQREEEVTMRTSLSGRSGRTPLPSGERLGEGSG